MDETPRPLSDRWPGALENDKCPVETGWLSSEKKEECSTPKPALHKAGINSGGAGKDCGNWHSRACLIPEQISVDNNKPICVPLPALRDENHLV